MIRVHGTCGSDEYDAAARLAEMARTAWPWLEASHDCWLDLVASVQCHGQSPKDIDLLVVGRFPDDRAFVRTRSSLTARDHAVVDARQVAVRSICATVEVKEHDPEGVRFDGTRISVRYREGWHDATAQSEKQKYSLKAYLQLSGISAPWITNLVWLRNVDPRHLPTGRHNILAGNATWNSFLNTIAENVLLERHEGYAVSAGNSTTMSGVGAAIELLTAKLDPTPLDRKKMDALSRRAIDAPWLSHLGSKQVVLRGRGGTGKTMLLLNAAWRKTTDDGWRCLVLTYNKALVSDIRRLMELAGLTTDLCGPVLHVQTMHSFEVRLLKLLGLLEDAPDHLFYSSLEKAMTQLASLIRGSAYTRDDFASIVALSVSDFQWDLILIDEGQDCSDDERDVIRGLYGHERIIVADGVDQLIRRKQPCRWRDECRDEQLLQVALSNSLRLKRNLALFANELAVQLGIPGWSVRPSEDAIGGRIVVVEGDYFANLAMHKSLEERNHAAGNKRVDMLLCLPPSIAQAASMSRIVRTLADAGIPTWDGTDKAVRDTYPTSVDQLRIVQFESCRGLEGWISINLALDEFFAAKESEFLLAIPEEVSGSLLDPGLAATQFASLWAMIPLTRAMDTLVISLGLAPSPIKSALQALRGGTCADFLEWHRVECPV